jgi:hypothetical protein
LESPLAPSRQLSSTSKITIITEPFPDLAEDADAPPVAGASAGHWLVDFTPYKQAFVLLAATLEELHP